MRPLQQSMDTLSNDSFVILDPAVETLDVEIGDYRLMSHDYFEVGMAVPPGDGLLTFVTTLKGKPVRVGDLRDAFDDQQLIDKMLTSLSQHGFVHATSEATLSIEDLRHLRDMAEGARNETLRRAIIIDLNVPMSIEDLCLGLYAGDGAPEVTLRCAALADHRKTIAELARLRQARTIRLHHVVVQTAELTRDAEICRSLIRLGASVTLEGVPWPPADRTISGLAEMTSHAVAVHALMEPDLSILDAAVRDRLLAWAGAVFISGLCLRLDPEVLWPSADATEDDFIELFDAVRTLEDKFGDVLIVNLPSDEVLLGNTTSSLPHFSQSDFARRFRKAYLHWRIPFLKACENDNTWSQIPEVEDKLVRLQEDLLPNHPDLLRLVPGSLVVDVCGGLGRVARRLSPVVGPDGLIISIEMLRCLSDRARRFACERAITNVHFRPGLAQRIALPDGVADAAVNEWTGGIWELGIGPAMIGEMARVVRPGGRIAVTHRLVRLPLAQLGQPWVQYDDIYDWMRQAFVHPQLTILTERVWGQIAPSMVGEYAAHWRKQYMPRLLNPFDVTYDHEESPGPNADVYLTIIAQRR